MAFRSDVCADRTTACTKASTSRTAFWASQTIQNAMASTFTGTVSAVRVVSALKSLTLIRWSTNCATLSMIGTTRKTPEGLRARNVPKRSNTAFSHW